jgi:DNA gyrase subunit A
VNESRRYEANRIVVETQSGKTQEFGPNAIKSQGRAGTGVRPGERTRFDRVIPPTIELVNWEEIDGKPRKDGPERNGDHGPRLYEG